MTQSKIYTRILLIVALIFIINLISFKFFFRLDFTEDGRYSLSDATKNILKDLDEPVTVTAYMTEDLPPSVGIVRKELKEMLIEYSSLSNGNVQYEFIDPATDQEVEREAMMNGIQPVLLNMREKDEAVQKKVYLGLILQMGENKEVIPVIQTGGAMEYTLSTNIKKMAVIDKPLIGMIQGHGEPPMANLNQVMQEMNVLYDVEMVDLNTSQGDLSQYKTIALIAPTDSIPPHHFSILDNYLANGGNMMIALNRVKAELQQGQGMSLETGLETWLAQKGLLIENNFVIDDQCGNIGVQQQQGMFRYTTPVKFPYLPMISNFADHPVTKGLEQVMFQFASTLSYQGDSSIAYTPLVFTSEKSGTQNSPTFFNIQKQWTKSDFPLSNLTLGAALQGPIVGNTLSSMVVFGDGDFAVGQGQQSQVNPDNVSLMVNAIDWMSDDTGLIDLRTKAITSRPLDDVENSTFLKYLNFLLPIILILIYGFFRLQRRRAIRVRRMEKGAL